MTIAITPYISKSGQCAMFFALNTAAPPVLQTISQVASNATITVNGSAVQAQGPIWETPASAILFPFLVYQLSCGPVQSIVVQKGGTGYIAPTATATGGGGSGCVLGTPVVAAGVITSIPVTTAGSGYTSPPTITITDGLFAVPPISVARRPGGRGWRYGGRESGSQRWRPASGGGGSGCIAAPVMAGVQPGDTVTYSAAASWLTAGGSLAPSASGAPVANYSGQLEPGLGGAVDFNMPAALRTLKTGFVVPWPHVQSTMNFNVNQNWIRRGENWTNAVTSSVDGHPLTITGTASVMMDDPSSNNGVDGRNWPSQTGTWTFIADDTNPGSLMTVTMTCNPKGTVTALGTAGLVSGGALVGGVQVGRVWQWDVERVASPATHNLGIKLNVTVTGAVGTYNWTLTNEALFTPLATLAASPGGGAPYPSRTNLLGPDQSMVNWLTTPRPRYPASIRYECGLGYAQAASIIDAYDLRNGTDFSWSDSTSPPGQPTRRRLIAVQSIRTYATTSSGWPAGWAAGPVTWSSPTVNVHAWSTLTGEGVSSIAVSNGGSGYTNPTASVTGGGGSGCVLGTPVRSGNVITSIPVKVGGSGYTSAPTVVISDPNGINAAAVAVMVTLSQGIASVLVDYGGTGYTAPTATATGGGGSGCVLGVPVLASGVITSIPVTAAGSGYTSPPTINITDANGTAAIATAVAAVTPADSGWINYSGPGAQWYVGEFVTATPHNVKTGQLMNVNVGNTSFSISNGTAAVIATNLSGVSGLMGWVTGPTTIAFMQYWGPITSGTGGQMPGGINNVAGTFAVNYSFIIDVPPYGCTPPEVNAAISASFPNCNHYVNIPHGATDLCCAEIARRVRDNFPKGRQVYVEYSNENWNFISSIMFTHGMGLLNAWGSALGNSTIAYATRAWQHHQTFISVFNQADINGNVNRGSEVVRLFASQAAGASGVTQAIVNYANAYNSGSPAVPLQMDALTVASYCDVRSHPRPDPTVAATVNPTGGGAGGGLLAAGTYYVAYTWIELLSGMETAEGANSARASRSVQFTVAAGNIPRVTLPALPSWASSASIYLTPANGAGGTEVLYATGVTTVTTDLTTANTGTVSPSTWSRLPSMLTAAHGLATGHPTSLAYLSPTPWTRKAYLDCLRHQFKYSPLLSGFFGQGNLHLPVLASYVAPPGQGPGYIPYMITYEGGLEQLVPGVGTGALTESDGRYLSNKLTHDLNYDPDIYYAEMAHLQVVQQGQFKIAQNYAIAGQFGALGGPDMGQAAAWFNCTWSGQPAGRGDGSGTTTAGSLGPVGTAVTNQFWVDDLKAHHVDNASVRLQAWRDWSDTVNPIDCAPIRGPHLSRPIHGPKLWAMHG